MIRLIVGLGNKGSEYSNTRHNAGFWYLDKLLEGNNLDISKFELNRAFGYVTKFDYLNTARILFKPNTYMNISGNCVNQIATFYQIDSRDILVVHDDLDIEVGAIRLKYGGGTGGHNGLKSIQQFIGKDFWRLRIGIGRPRSNRDGIVSDYVLQSPTKNEKAGIYEAIDSGLLMLERILQEDYDNVMQFLHTRP